MINRNGWKKKIGEMILKVTDKIYGMLLKTKAKFLIARTNRNAVHELPEQSAPNWKLAEDKEVFNRIFNYETDIVEQNKINGLAFQNPKSTENLVLLMKKMPRGGDRKQRIILKDFVYEMI